jgi:hypothetical protein
MVWVDSEGGSGETAFKITFTDAAGLGHMLRGVKKLEVSDIPKFVDAPMPYNPSMVDSDGKPVVDGRTYHWADGAQAQVHNGRWEPVKIPNDTCQSK